MRALRLVPLLLTLATPAAASTYYLAPAGSDARSCTTAQAIGTPKATFASAVTCLSAGDTLYVRAGTYAEALTWFGWPGGTLGTNWATAITISAYQGELVTLRPPVGPEFVLVMRGSASAATDAPRYLIFTGITFDGTNVTRDGVAVRAWDSSITPADSPAHHIRLLNSRVTNVPAGNGVFTTWGSEGVELIGTEIDHINGPAPGPTNTQGIFGAASDMLIENCRIHDNWGYGISNINGVVGQATSGHIIRNNLVHHNGTGGGGFGGINLGEGTGHQVYNNVVYDNGGPGLILAYGAGSTGTTLWNNTVSANASIGINIHASQSDAVVQNNVSVLNGTSNYANSGARTTEDHNVLAGDPLFVNPAGDDFQLQAASPLINQGATLASVTTDVAGLSRPQGTAYDIGAYEYGASTTPIITTTSVANAVVGVAYAAPFSATSGTAPYTWALTSGSLPPGVAFNSNGLITGTPTTAGAYVLAVRVTDTFAQTASATIGVLVRAAVSITTTSPLPAAERLNAYQANLVATGDEAPYTWTLVSGSLPDGLSLFSVGVLAGTPTTISGQTTATVRVTGWLGSTTTKALALSVITEYRPPTRPISRNAAEGIIFRRLTAPTNPADRVMRGDVWLNTSTTPPTLMMCTAATATSATWAVVP